MIGFSGISAPTAKQVRYALQVHSDKPHIGRGHGEWRCVGRHYYGYGATPYLAYFDWLSFQGKK